ncbi:uroporphyrinogen-III synthase [uncultured Dokdonia sp.]|uniref:uroporphyrinogen-III synthase n=1 Tax=uncultured Dokdonia sp. TaxID=575653 RepID=UPI002612BC1F|nr:uroporphyrinogen-III synthase [uncultured Dokdonia sp.]
MKRISKKDIARHLRQEQTPAEEFLWEVLRNRQFEDLKFRRQHPIKNYIVDFCCLEIMLIVELDGGYHNTIDQKEKDELRDIHLRQLGYRVLRYKNNIALKNHTIILNDISIRNKEQTPSPLKEKAGMRILSTKKLQPNQRELILNAGLSFVEYDAISMKPIDFDLPESLKNVIITSQNGAKFFIEKTQELASLSGEELEVRCFCVGEKTTALLKKNGYNVIKTSQNGATLGHDIAENHKKDSFTYFCGKQRREELPNILKEAGVTCNEVVVYETHINEQIFNQIFDGVLFFSPSGVTAFAKANLKNTSLLEERKKERCFCIGETTAAAARKYTNQVVVSNATTIESTIAKAVNTLKK